MDRSRTPEIPVFFEPFSLSSYKSPPDSRKKRIVSSRLVFMPLRGVVLVDFANPLSVRPSTRLAIEISGSRSQIDRPTDLGRHKTYPYRLRFD